MTASDDYQSCVLKDLAAQKAAAKASKTKLSQEAIDASQKAVDANQADKEQAGKAYNDAAHAYKAAHPS